MYLSAAGRGAFGGRRSPESGCASAKEDRMHGDETVEELATILARGYLRYRKARRRLDPDLGDLARRTAHLRTTYHLSCSSM